MGSYIFVIFTCYIIGNGGCVMCYEREALTFGGAET